jgi:hypothetical protein
MKQLLGGTGMTSFDTDPGLADDEMDEVLGVIVDYLKRHPEIGTAQIRVNRAFAGTKVSPPLGNMHNARMKVAREDGGRWAITARNEPTPRGLSSLISGGF